MVRPTTSAMVRTWRAERMLMRTRCAHGVYNIIIIIYNGERRTQTCIVLYINIIIIIIIIHVRTTTGPQSYG